MITGGRTTATHTQKTQILAVTSLSMEVKSHLVTVQGVDSLVAVIASRNYMIIRVGVAMETAGDWIKVSRAVSCKSLYKKKNVLYRSMPVKKLC